MLPLFLLRFTLSERANRLGPDDQKSFGRRRNASGLGGKGNERNGPKSHGVPFLTSKKLDIGVPDEPTVSM